MRLAVMQPYLFPYIGYFQLINAVDSFVLYDDVSFIKQGWINRNRILVSGKPLFFTVPIKKQSSFKRISETEIVEDQRWLKKVLSSLKYSYGKAVYFNEAMDIVTGVLCAKTRLISEMASISLVSICNYLDIGTKFIYNPDGYNNSSLKKEDRIIDICLKEGADEYINLIGGKELYSKEKFQAKGIGLHFLEPKDIRYVQFGADFAPWLSIIDVIMFNPIERIKHYLRDYILS